MTSPFIRLGNGISIPQVGLGVYQVNPEKVYDTVTSALDIGYRHIDTASYYDNEEGVGQAIVDAGIDREDLFVTTKVWNDEQGYNETLKAFDRSLNRLKLDEVDLYLIHWPIKDVFHETWEALEHLYKKGRVKAIGVSNFLAHHLESLIAHAEEKPVINQIECHPKLIQQETIDYCQANNIKIESWAPLGRSHYLDDPLIQKLAHKYEKTPAQIMLRWHIENEFIIIPRSTNESRQRENIQIFDFSLTDEEVKQVTDLEKEDYRIGSHPDEIGK